MLYIINSRRTQFLYVEYNLTNLGKSFLSVFEHTKQWGDENLSE